jgi:hypothetical protein
MANELEHEIMCEIGLGNTPTWYNGGDCAGARRIVLRKIKDVIEQHHRAGKAIIAPNERLINLLQEADGWDESDYLITTFYAVASYVVSTHINAFSKPRAQCEHWITEQINRIRAQYQPESARALIRNRILDDQGWGKFHYVLPEEEHSDE